MDRKVIKTISTIEGFECIGVRMEDGGDIPLSVIAETWGISEEKVLKHLEYHKEARRKAGLNA